MDIQISEYKPSAVLQPFVEFFWEGEFNKNGASALRQRVVPNGFVELIIHVSDLHCQLFRQSRWLFSPAYTIIGLYTQSYTVNFTGHVKVFGIRFKPEGIFNIFRIPASLFHENFEDMEAVLGKEFYTWCNQLCDTQTLEKKLTLTENYLVRNLQLHTPGLSYINKAAELIRNTKGLMRIEELSNHVFISLRQLEREFKYKVGITPKQYMRIARLNEVHRQLNQNQSLNFSQITFECGYADQAHFIRDFKMLTGANPKRFIRDRSQYIVNVPVVS